MFQINHYCIQNKRVFPIQPKQALEFNSKQGEIYWTPNNFSEYGKRTKADLRQITCFFCEIDHGEKLTQEEFIKRGPVPSSIIETKRGFQIYWYLENPIDVSDDPIKWADWFHDFVSKRIVPVYGADSQAADACRLLRLPFYCYWKDGKGYFIINIVLDTDFKYSREQIEKYFPKRKEPKQETHRLETSITQDGGVGFWRAANVLPVKNSLMKLSGTSIVGGESLTFRRQKDIERIVVNGKDSNAWIDKNGKIGSTAGAGPAVPNWIYYYEKDWKKVAEILKEYFPELKDRK